ncbi:hypothetical protein MA16_Dca024473 [Dendrobium catenatum]|uniref:WW domain-containing protein n=1 Tax=Dendrobium catenatum TaxID=906689 RepID=A0A2I0V9A0_9ASPA|nr:hypothetical protein MA16_Dca024473 [Dendrobium catenatum]
MAAPNIESIAASLRNYSHNSRRGAASPAAAAESKEVTVELNSVEAFPNHWKQCLDMKTGKLFYVNGKSGERKTEVPRIAASGLQASYNSSEEYNSDDAGGGEDEEDNDGDIEDCSSLAGDGTDYEDFFGVSSRNSHNSSSDDSIAGDGNGGAGSLILVVAGCKSCFMYFIVPKRVDECPKCGGCLLHLDS